jgi:hypothetical protein
MKSHNRQLLDQGSCTINVDIDRADTPGNPDDAIFGGDVTPHMKYSINRHMPTFKRWGVRGMKVRAACNGLQIPSVAAIKNLPRGKTTLDAKIMHRRMKEILKYVGQAKTDHIYDTFGKGTGASICVSGLLPVSNTSEQQLYYGDYITFAPPCPKVENQRIMPIAPSMKKPGHYYNSITLVPTKFNPKDFVADVLFDRVCAAVYVMIESADRANVLNKEDCPMKAINTINNEKMSLFEVQAVGFLSMLCKIKYNDRYLTEDLKYGEFCTFFFGKSFDDVKKLFSNNKNGIIDQGDFLWLNNTKMKEYMHMIYNTGREMYDYSMSSVHGICYEDARPGSQFLMMRVNN